MVVLKIIQKNGREDTLVLTQDDLVNKRFNRKNSILDILLNKGHEIPFGCMGGSCSACVVELVSGGEYIDFEGLHEQVYKGIEENEFLTCIASVKDNVSDDASIEIKTKF